MGWGGEEGIGAGGEGGGFQYSIFNFQRRPPRITLIAQMGMVRGAGNESELKNSWKDVQFPRENRGEPQRATEFHREGGGAGAANFEL